MEAARFGGEKVVNNVLSPASWCRRSHPARLCRFAVFLIHPSLLLSSAVSVFFSFFSLCLLRVALCFLRVALLASVLSPCPSLCVGGGGVSCVALRAQLGRLGGSRWGWVLQNKIKFPCHTNQRSLVADIALNNLISLVTPLCLSSILWVWFFDLASNGCSLFCVFQVVLSFQVVLVVIIIIISIVTNCSPASSLKRHYSPSPFRALVSRQYGNQHHHLDVLYTIIQTNVLSLAQRVLCKPLLAPQL